MAPFFQTPASFLVLTLISFSATLRSASGIQSYKDGEPVMLYVNKVGPYFNPQETYHYYQLPVCRPDKIEHRSLSLGEVLDGDRMAHSMYKFEFKRDANEVLLCKTSISGADIQELKRVIEELYYFEFVLDDLPIRGFVGHFEEGGIAPLHEHKTYLWTHHHFNIHYNGDHVISANVTTKDHTPTNLDKLLGGDAEGAVTARDVRFTYSVQWIPTTMNVEDRDRILESGKASFLPRSMEIQWLAVANSSILNFLLIVFVIIILARILRNDFARYNLGVGEGEKADVESLDQEEYGWKIIHADVFRLPSNLPLFCAVIGVGTQFLVTIAGILMLALFGFFNVHHHGSMNSAVVILYALTSSVAGFTAAALHRHFTAAASPIINKGSAKSWVWTVNLTACVFAVPFFGVWSVNNSIAWAMGATQAIPVSTVLLLSSLLLFLGLPLTVVGGILGKNLAPAFDPPCRTKNIPREIPQLPWHRSLIAHLIVGGFIPFSAISVELYYIFSTLWGREQYTLYGILFLVFGILLSVTACISVALTYFQLAAEDHRWWWRSVFSSGATGGFVFLYSLFYFHWRSNMSGLLQTLEFLGYTVLTCYVFFLTLGAVGFFASLKFVKYIYRNIKMD